MFHAVPAELISIPDAAVTIAQLAAARNFRIRRACDESPDEIIVCGRRDGERYRIVRLPPPPQRVRTNPFAIDLAPNVSLGFGTVQGGLGTAAGFSLRIRF